MIGSDVMGEKFLHLMQELPASTTGLIAGKRPTTVKTRVVAQGQQVVRFDREETGAPSEETLNGLIAYIETHLSNFDAVIVSDYAKGVINEELMVRLHKLLAIIRREEKRPFPLIVDPKPSNLHRFFGATIITPNNHEAEIMSGMVIAGEQSLPVAARRICDEIDCRSVLITRGEAGMALWQEDGALITIPTTAKEVYDVTGAGDTVAATLALGLATGCSTKEAAVLANYAAGIVVGKVGTACVSRRELQDALATA
jgi:D-beta-D-heptose 7-phosphate kinase/D-beta-D-heptose 1-phosphate adenosyltransferase